MKIQTTPGETYATIVLRGDFDTDAAEAFLAQIGAQLASGQPRVAVSFRYVKYINSTALGSLVRARTKCRETGGELLVLQPSRLTRDVLVRLGLDKVVPIFDSADDAAAFLRGAVDAPSSLDASRSDDEHATVVMFTFHDERDDLIPGRHKHGVASLEAVDDQKVVLRFDPARFESSARHAVEMFRVGGSMRTKMQLKLMRKGFFEADAMIDSTSLDDDGIVTVRAHWTEIAETDRAALRRHREEIEYLDRQAAART